MNPAGSAEARNVPPGADCFSLIQSDDPRIQSCVLCVGLQEVWGNLRPEQSFKGLLCLLLKADLWKASLKAKRGGVLKRCCQFLQNNASRKHPPRRRSDNEPATVMLINSYTKLVRSLGEVQGPPYASAATQQELRAKPAGKTTRALH